MIQINSNTKVFISPSSIDFRKGIDGIASQCQSLYKEDPFSGSLFIFKNKRGTSIKILSFDGQGFWLCQKRLSKGVYKFWPKTFIEAQSLKPHHVAVLLQNGNPFSASFQPYWRNVG